MEEEEQEEEGGWSDQETKEERAGSMNERRKKLKGVKVRPIFTKINLGFIKQRCSHRDKLDFSISLYCQHWTYTSSVIYSMWQHGVTSNHNVTASSPSAAI